MNATPPNVDPDYLITLQTLVQAQRQRLLEDLKSRPTGVEWCRQHTKAADDVWRLLHREALRLFPDCPPVAIVATGGYGRQELSPASDIDVTLVPLAEDGNLDQAVKWLFRAADQVIRHGLGLRLAYVYRLPNEIAGLDAISLSNLLDIRHVAGSPEPLRLLSESLWTDFPSGPFILEKIEERERDKASTHRSPLVVEPDLKHGAGGLRCFHTANWIGQAIGERPAPPTPAVDEILKVRNLLHTIANRHLDLLNRQRREQVAETLGTDPFDLGSSLAHALDANHEHYIEGLRRVHESRFAFGPGTRALRGELRIEPGCPVGEAAVAVDVATRLGLVVAPASANVTHRSDPQVLNAFAGGEKTIRNLDRSGVLGALLPELAACKALMPRDASHRYTVYEHTLVALRTLHNVPPASPLGELYAQIKEPELLALALVLHDTGKADADPNLDHSTAGAQIARRVGQRWELGQTRTETVAWLVQEHLTMSKFMRMRDVMNPDTAREFADIVKTDQHLHMLALLTYADVSSVNKELWTPVQQQLMLELHARTWSILQAQEPVTPDEQAVRRNLVRRTRNAQVDEQEFAAFLDSLPAHYVLSTDGTTAQHHFQLVESINDGGIEVTFQDDPRLGVTEITVVAPDRPGSLTRILGVLYAYSIKILGLRASTTHSDRPILLDTFTVTASDRPVTPRTAANIKKSLVEIMAGGDLDALLLQQGKDPARKQEFIQVNVVPQDPAIIEVRAPRGRGLAYRLARVINELGLNIVAARVGQWAGSASAAFYVLNPDGSPVDPEAVRAAFLQSSPAPVPPDPQVSSPQKPLS